MRQFAGRIFPGVLTISAVACVLLSASAQPAWAYTASVVHSFCHAAGCIDGSIPRELLRDTQGNLYGTTHYGGKYKKGVIFKLVPNADGSKYTDHILHNFCAKTNCADGSEPYGNLIMDVGGSLYGTTAYGGASGSGVIWRLSPKGSGWKYTIWHSFCQEGCPDGSVPYSGLAYKDQVSGALWDKKTPLFGTTSEGGLGHGFTGYGNGVLYELGTDPFLIYIVVHKFKTSYEPEPVTVDGSGNLFGTTQYGGKFNGGQMYKFVPQGDGTWKETLLHSFCAESNCPDGFHPAGRLMLDTNGNIFGVTAYGGNCIDGCGVAFEKPAGQSYRLIYKFCSATNCTDGEAPFAGLIQDPSGNLLGTTLGGGLENEGVVFALTPGGAETVLYSFCPAEDCSGGAQPFTPVIIDNKGDLFGSTSAGGDQNNDGTVFELKP